MFMGQIIASLIVLTFVAVFLLREWVSQNARPGLFEDAADAPLREEDAPIPDPPAVIQPPPDDLQAAVAHAIAQPAFNVEPRPRLGEPRNVMQRRNLVPRRRHALEPRIRAVEKEREVDEDDPDALAPRRKRVNLRRGSESEGEAQPTYRDWPRTSRAVEDARLPKPITQSPLQINPDDAKFTFTAKLPSRETTAYAFGQDTPNPPSLFASNPSPWIPRECFLCQCSPVY